MTDAPERLAVHWTTADRDTMPSSVGALTPKDSGFLLPPPAYSHAERVAYRRADLPPTLAEALKVPEVRALVEAVEALKLRDLVAGWNGEGRDTPYAPHPPHLWAKITTTCGVVYAIDAALAKLAEGGER